MKKFILLFLLLQTNIKAYINFDLLKFSEILLKNHKEYEAPNLEYTCQSGFYAEQLQQTPELDTNSIIIYKNLYSFFQKNEFDLSIFLKKDFQEINLIKLNYGDNALYNLLLDKRLEISPNLITQEEYLKINELFFNYYSQNSNFTNKDNWFEKQNLFSHPKIFYAQKKDLSNPGNLIFTGDIHGSIFSLLRNFWRWIALGLINNKLEIINQNNYFIFLGDYVDRGFYSVEVDYLLKIFFLNNPQNVILIRGNHELEYINVKYGFKKELENKYKGNNTYIYNIVNKTFDFLPTALFIGYNQNYILCCHGGVGQNIDSKLTNLFSKDNIIYTLLDASSINFLWSDFIQYKINSSSNDSFLDSERGLGQSVTVQGWNIFQENFSLIAKKLIGIVRGHQHNDFGIKMLCQTIPENIFTEIYAKHPYINLSFDDSFNGSPDFKGPYNWKIIVPQEIQNDPNGIPFISEYYAPIYTFSNANEGTFCPYDSFGILNITEDPINWRFKLYEIPLFDLGQQYFPKFGNNYEGKYLSININYRYNYPIEMDPINFKYNNLPQNPAVDIQSFEQFENYQKNLIFEVTKYFHFMPE